MLPHFFQNSLMDQVKKLRNTAKDGDVTLAQSAQQLSCVQGFQINHPRTANQGQQQIGHLSQRVKKWQHA